MVFKTLCPTFLLQLYDITRFRYIYIFLSEKDVLFFEVIYNIFYVLRKCRLLHLA